ELAEQGRPGGVALHVHSEECVHVGSGLRAEVAQGSHVQVPRLELPAHPRGHPGRPKGEGPAPGRVEPEPVQIHEAVDARAQGVTAVELGGDRLELGAGRAEGDRKMIHAVRVVGKQHALDAARSPVAGENAEEYLTQPPLPADVRLGELSGDMLRRIPVGIVLGPSIYDRVTYS